MSEFIHLVGAEDVRKAGSQMASAADDMLRAANIINESHDQFIRRFDELVTRMEMAQQTPEARAIKALWWPIFRRKPREES